MDKLKMQTENIADKNFEVLSKMFPNALTETITGYDDDGKPIVERAIDVDVLRQEISCKVVEGKDERYQFTWPDKKKAIVLANEPISDTLRPCREKSINFDETENIYIEGDNIDVLKILQETYLGKIKLIYIDPPYNTKSDAFVYDDDFSMNQAEFELQSGRYDEQGNILFNIKQNNEANGKFHTDWLNMLYSRLKLSKNLLSEDGIILINMDENEIVNLQKVCIEIFGEQNDLGTIVWDKRNPKGDAKGISYQHEYILAYAKNKVSFLENCTMQRPKKNAESMIKKAKSLFAKVDSNYSLDDANKEFAQWLNKQTDISGGERAYNRMDDCGRLYQAVSMAWPNKKTAPDDYFVPLIHPVTGKKCPIPDRGWRNPSSTMKSLLENGLIVFGSDETTQPRRKYLLEENMYENIPSLIYYGGSDTAFLQEIGVPFETPKVVDICKEHIVSFTNENDIILDFFSGSGTIAHATMQVNADCNSHRKFIMVQLPEICGEKSSLGKKGYRTICDAGEDRIRKAGERILKDNQNVDIGMRVFKCVSSNMKDIYYTPSEVQQSLFDTYADNIKEDRTPEDLLFQVMLDLGVLLSSKIEETTIAGKQVFNVADGFLIACFDNDVTEETVKAVAEKKPYYAVFRDSSMANDSVATNFDQIFASISPDTVRKVL